MNSVFTNFALFQGILLLEITVFDRLLAILVTYESGSAGEHPCNLSAVEGIDFVQSKEYMNEQFLKDGIAWQRQRTDAAQYAKGSAAIA